VTRQELEKQYKDQIRFVTKNFVVHPDTALIPALATCAAGLQQKHAEFEQKVWEASWDLSTPERPRPKAPGFQDTLSEASMEKIAADLKLDVAKLKADMKGDRCKTDPARAAAQFGRFGINGTPAFFINGRFIGGRVPIERFKIVIDEEIKKAEAVEKAEGVKAQDYYQKFVVEKGKKNL
jgi:protein-disulfide isomerase